MPRKVTKKRKSFGDSDSDVSSSDSESCGRRGGGALSKFKEFDVSEVLQMTKDVVGTPAGVEGELISDNNDVMGGPVTFSVTANMDASTPAVANLIPPATGATDVDPTAASTATTSQEPAVVPIPQLIPPEPLKDLPPDEEFVPLPTIQVVPMMNRNAEAQSGLLKEPAPPASIQRVTKPGLPPPAMSTTLMQLLCE